MVGVEDTGKGTGPVQPSGGSGRWQSLHPGSESTLMAFFDGWNAATGLSPRHNYTRSGAEMVSVTSVGGVVSEGGLVEVIFA
jgi:hypothetical protein